MVIVMVAYKSLPENYIKEEKGIKPNTLRVASVADYRIRALRKGIVKEIKIVNSENGEYFIRTITDYTEWLGWAVISWKHRE